LDAHGEYRLRTFLRHIAITIANGRLGLHGVQEGGHHVGHLRHAHRVRHVGHQIGRLVLEIGVLQVIVRIGDDPPDEPEEGPREDEAGGEDK